MVRLRPQKSNLGGPNPFWASERCSTCGRNNRIIRGEDCEPGVSVYHAVFSAHSHPLNPSLTADGNRDSGDVNAWSLPQSLPTYGTSLKFSILKPTEEIAVS